MRISLITPTCDRPRGVALCERYIARQTVRPDEWIVADSGREPAPLTMGQVHIRQPMPPGARNLATNMMAALDRATGDLVVVVEDDDHYAATHLEECVAGLQRAAAHGCPALHYFNVEHRLWTQMRNVGAALCQTAVRRELVPALRAAAQAAHEANDFGIDRRFWAPRTALAVGPMTVIGIKGLPGQPGLGIGHRPRNAGSKRWHADPKLSKLEEWIGADVEHYRC